MSDTAPNPHRLDLSIDRYGVHAKFECTADQNAPCHQWPDCSCEEGWDRTSGPVVNGLPEGDACKHPKALHDDCWMKDWFEACDPFELYDGPDDHAIASVPINARFDGDDLQWEATS